MAPDNRNREPTGMPVITTSSAPFASMVDVLAAMLLAWRGATVVPFHHQARGSLIVAKVAIEMTSRSEFKGPF
jgi:hypothetical protein